MKNIKNKLILSISFCFHDSAITFSDYKEILLHLEAEKVFRRKHMRFANLEETEQLIKIGLKYLNKTIDDVNEVLITKWNNMYNDDNVTILGKRFKAIITNHHENHIGTSLPSNYNRCVILCSDGGSENGTTKLYYKKNHKIWLIDNLDNRPFTGKFYGTIAQMLIEPRCSKAHHSAVGKLMSLSAYGKYNHQVQTLINENIKELNQLHFDGCEDLLKVFNLNTNYDKPWLDDYKKDIAHTAHNFWIKSCCAYLKQHRKFSNNICLVGGCALNVLLNAKLLTDRIYNNVYVSPISGDSGQSLGAILYRYPKIKCNYPYLGRGKEANYLYDEEVINDLLDGKIISWFQGRGEIGARALGHRSFMGIPTSKQMKVKISEKVKRREAYRPVAAIIPEHLIFKYFHQCYPSPYMTFSAKAKAITKRIAPAIIHVDGTTMIQTINQFDNPVLYSILMKLDKKIGVPILMNTSFNIREEPIVDTEADAILTHKKSKADELYINGIKYQESKLISLIIPTYNNDKKLIALLNSFQPKMEKALDIEIIVVQNHFDKTVYKNTKRLEKQYNIVVYHQIKQGKAAALNLGIKKANGKYIASIDDDVIVADQEWLYNFVEEFNNNCKLGYVSGKILMYQPTANYYSNIWENKGGLSKGETKKYWSRKFLNQFKFNILPWPMHKICVGANQMIRKDVLLEIGGYEEFLGTRENVDGLTLEIGYKIANAGYELLYNPEIVLYHQHPTSEQDIKNKLYYYGIQDTGVAMYIFLANKDYRYLWWAIIGHPIYTISKIIKSIFKCYPLPVNYIIYGLKGNLKGWRICLKNYKRGGWNNGINFS